MKETFTLVIFMYDVTQDGTYSLMAFDLNGKACILSIFVSFRKSVNPCSSTFILSNTFVSRVFLFVSHKSIRRHEWMSVFECNDLLLLPCVTIVSYKTLK